MGHSGRTQPPPRVPGFLTHLETGPKPPNPLHTAAAGAKGRAETPPPNPTITVSWDGGSRRGPPTKGCVLPVDGPGPTLPGWATLGRAPPSGPWLPQPGSNRVAQTLCQAPPACGLQLGPSPGTSPGTAPVPHRLRAAWV